MTLSGAIVGLGRMGKIHAKNLLQHPMVDLKAVCSLDHSHRDWALRNLGEIASYEHLEKLIEHQALDFVVLVTPSLFHVAQIALCLSKGLHVFCEKPLAMDEKSCQELETLMVQYPHQAVMVGFMRRFDRSYIEMKKLFQDGVIGKPILFRGYSADADRYIESYLPFAEKSAGHFLDMCIHDIDLMNWLFEENPIHVTALSGCFKHHELKAYGGDNASALFQMKSGAMAFLYTGRTAAHGYQIETEVIGTEGSIRIGNGPSANMVEVFNQEGRIESYAQDFAERFEDAFEEELNYFISQVLDGLLCKPSVQEANHATRIALLAQRSLDEDKRIYWNE